VKVWVGESARYDARRRGLLSNPGVPPAAHVRVGARVAAFGRQPKYNHFGSKHNSVERNFRSHVDHPLSLSRSIPKSAVPFLRRFGSLLCLLGYVGVATPLLPLGAAGLAWVDGAHSVSLAAGSRGVAVVLGHEPANSVPTPAHTHRVLATALVSMAAATPGQADHVLNFHSGGVALVPEETLSIAGNEVGESAMEFLPFAHAAAGPPVHGSLPGSRFLPLPFAARVVQTTVLLI